MVGRLRARALPPLLAAAVVVLFAFAPTAEARSYSYDWHDYNTYVSHGLWRTHSSMTNSTSTWITWTISLTDRRCIEVKGSTSLAIEAGLVHTSSWCTSASRTYRTGVAPRSSLAFIRRPVTHYVYYVIRKYDHRGSLVTTGYAHTVDSFTDYAFASY